MSSGPDDLSVFKNYNEEEYKNEVGIKKYYNKILEYEKN